MTGNFVVGTNDTITFLTSQDFVTEGPEYATISLDNGRSSAEILINDTANEYDPYYTTAGTSLLLTGEDYGTANPLTFTDTSPNNTAFTMQGTGSYVRNIDLYNGNFSYLFSGTDYLSFNASTAFNIGTQDASVELFVRFNTVPTSDQTLCGQNSGGGATLRHFAAAGGYVGAHVNGDSGYIAKGPSIVAGRWYHCLLTYSAQEQLVRYFVDGKLYGVKTGVSSIPARNEAYFIGNEEAGGLIYGLNGRISNFRYCVGAIPTEYQTTSVAVGEQTYSVPTAPLTPTASTVLMTACTPQVTDISTYKHAYTAVCTSSVLSPFADPEKYHYGFGSFNGASAIYNDASTALNFGTGAFTVETWVNFNSLTTGAGKHNVVLASGQANGGFQIYKVDITNTVMYGGMDVSENPVIPAAEVAAGRWYHIAIVRESTAANKTRVYVNGQLRYTYTDTKNYNINGVVVGGYKIGLYFPGYIGPTRVVKGSALYSTNFEPAPLTAVSGTSLLLNFENLGITDKSTAKFPISNTWGALPNAAIKKYGDRSIYFNGNNRLDFPYYADHYLPGVFTIEFWMNSGNTPAGRDIINFGGGLNVAYPSYYVRSYPGGIRLGISTNNAGENFVEGTWPDGTAPIGQWAHVACTRSGNTYRVYINGIKTGEAVITGTPYDPSPRGLQVGASCQTTWGSAPYNGYTGYIDDLRITKGVARYTSAVFAPPAKLPVK